METELLHIWNRCHGCGASPIVGARFVCQTCPEGPDSDLCERCHGAFAARRLVHPPPGSFAEACAVQLDRPHFFARFTLTHRVHEERWSEVSGVIAAAPSIPERSVVRPEFCTRRGSFIGSYSFVIEGSPRFLLTCLHVLSGVMQTHAIDASTACPTYSGRELPAIVTGVNLYDVYAANWMLAPVGYASTMLTLPEARTKEEAPSAQRDIAAFVIDAGANVQALRLAARAPGVGQPVWLAARLGQGAKQRTLAAVVVEQSDRAFVFRYLDDTVSVPPAASGAPLVDRAGEVVGINVGLGRLAGKQLGYGCDVASIRRHRG